MLYLRCLSFCEIWISRISALNPHHLPVNADFLQCFWTFHLQTDVNSRCEDFARQNIANSYLTHLNAGQQMIPPHLLMPYVEESIDYLQSEYGKNEYREKVLFLKKVFIDLNADDSIVRNIQPQFKTEEEPVINENTETDLEK